MVAAVRADSVNVPLFIHVLGAMLLVGALLFVATALLLAWRRTEPGEVTTLTRLGLRWLFIGVLPAYVVMRVGAQWTESEEFDDGPDVAWLDIGYLTSDLGAILIIVCLVVAGIVLWRLRAGDVQRAVLARIVGVVSVVLLAAYLVAVWAMTAKPD